LFKVRTKDLKANTAWKMHLTSYTQHEKWLCAVNIHHCSANEAGG